MCITFLCVLHLLCLRSKFAFFFLTCTLNCFFYSKTLLTDPTDEEESLCNGVLHIIVKNEELCSVLKPGGSPLTDELLLECISSSKEHFAHVKKLIDIALNDIK